MEENISIINAAIAGLLHDIGKLEQRARDDPWNSAPGIDREGQPVHATWTLYFAQHHVFQRYRPAALAGAYHHAPEKSPGVDNRLSMLVSLADKLSAGERADPLDESSKDSKPPRQLVTIFDRITFHGSAKREGWHYLPLQAISLDEAALFPGEPTVRDQEIASYEALRDMIRAAASQPIDDPAAYLENLLAALQRAAWCIPSAYYHSIPDVSLYDHCRMTAALAVCLSARTPDQIKDLSHAVQLEFLGKAEEKDREMLKTPAALLLGGDISGIQDFIYTISSKGAAKTLRGRSFYLQLLTEAVLRYVLAELGIPYTNVIYSGGGHFYLIAPVEAEDKLLAIRKAVTLKLLKHHGASLYLALGAVKVPAGGFRIGRFPEYWTAMHRELARAKQQRYTELGDEFYSRVFVPPEFGGNPDATCSVCGEDIRPVADWDEEREEQARICTLCKSFTDEIGKRLPQSSHVALGIIDPVESPVSTALDVLREFGLQIQFLTNAADQLALPQVNRVILWALDDPGDSGWPGAGATPVSRMLRYTVHRVPPLSFDELQERVRGGFERLGVLRMDVDNLGEIFTRGFGEPGAAGNLSTLARLSTLSFQISLFFEGWVKKLCEQQPELVYPVYSGGDDLFLIGPWDIMPGLAADIRSEFSRFTAGHPALSISGGLAFIGGKYPIYQAAQDAQQAEAQAKESGKDAFSFLGQAWSWSVFNLLAEKKQRILRIVARREIDIDSLEGPQAVLQVLRQLAADEADEVRRMKGRPVWGRWMWQGPYQLTRMAERQRNKPELATAINQLRDDLDKNNYSEINQWGAAARWAQLESRKSGKEE